jgi:predicted ATPase
MKITNLKVEKLHGYIDKDIDFESDLTLLVGINGSGKTSILNLINWLISPSLPQLCVTEFKSLTLNFDYRKESYEIKCKHNKATFNYSIKSTKKTYSPLIVRLHKQPKQIKNDDYLKASLIEEYTDLSPDEKEKETWDIISSFPSPTIIGLDRNLYTEESSGKVYFEKRHKTRVARKSVSPLDRVKELINREYRKKKNEVSNLTNSLKNHLMLSSFDGSITLETLASATKYKLTLIQIEKAEETVNSYFRNFERESLSEESQSILNSYFSKLKIIVGKYQEDPEDHNVKVLYALNANQFIKIRKLLKEFEKFESKSLKAMERIQNYLDTLNFFLKDSAKQILFREDTSELTFINLDKHGNAVTEHKDINYLSSGEQQILILFSYIAFNSGDGRIFIIDEPELSLHIKWQEDFLEKLNSVTPKGTQLILATHSPILANKRRDKAIALLPYND